MDINGIFAAAYAQALAESSVRSRSEIERRIDHLKLEIGFFMPAAAAAKPDPANLLRVLKNYLELLFYTDTTTGKTAAQINDELAAEVFTQVQNLPQRERLVPYQKVIDLYQQGIVAQGGVRRILVSLLVLQNNEVG